ncbi:uncharacterized protein LOC124264611 [Haliotis rubra]|uniref:uncharacterized protein LOC124264611 n=1 Tax=Haliotis rubra TaxID=36100 RepID=UPI001EE53A1D|nr:uncharacterized protein LOC124264611 [Haliotis rubra]
MMQQANRTFALITACISCTALCTTTLTCPDVTYLGGSAQLSCSTSSPYNILQYRGPNGSIAPQCHANMSLCSPVEGFNGIIINTTHTILKILKVQSRHEGLWTCLTGNTGGSASCELRVKNKGPAAGNETGTSWITILAVVVPLIVILIGVIVAACVLKRRKQQSNSEKVRSDQISREEIEPTYDTIPEPKHDTVTDPVSEQSEAMESSNPTQATGDVSPYACVDIVSKPITTVQNLVSVSNRVNNSETEQVINRSDSMKNDESEKKVDEMYATVNKRKDRDKKGRC